MSTREGLHTKAPEWTAAEKLRWHSFTPQEFDCKGSGEYWHDSKALDMLQAMRNDLGQALIINSGHRSEQHNRNVNGARYSQHRKWAVDISTNGHDRKKLVQAAVNAGFRGIGLGKTFLHLDPRPTKTVWPYQGGANAYWTSALGRDPVGAAKRMLGA